jgi:hypothetical protein
MDETRSSLSLPDLEIEIVHKTRPEDGAEYLGIQLRAPAGFSALAANPFTLWAGLLQAAWSPWLALNPFAAYLLPPKRD